MRNNARYSWYVHTLVPYIAFNSKQDLAVATITTKQIFSNMADLI